VAYVILGARGASWRGADWVVRNVDEFFAGALLRQPKGGPLGEAWSRALLEGRRIIDLSSLLDDEGARTSWYEAVRETLSEAMLEEFEMWHEPQRYPPYLNAIRDLGRLSHIDGNVLVTGLAERMLDA